MPIQQELSAILTGRESNTRETVGELAAKKMGPFTLGPRPGPHLAQLRPGAGLAVIDICCSWW